MDLQEISDRLEIQDVLTRYTRAVDEGDWDRLDTVFTPDAEIDYTESGGIAGSYAEAKKWLAETLPAFFSKTLHTVGQVSVEYAASGDEARVVAYFDNPMLMRAGDGEEKVVEVGGKYHHTMIRTPDGWRSRRLHEELVWKRGL
jgi:ketosteroid isomerase-like protein